jgi:hypothetical protein
MSDATPAQALARHVQAALIHLCQAERLAELAGVDVAGVNDAARLLQAIGNLDMWTVNNARGDGAPPAGAYGGTENRCHAEGGMLAAGADRWSYPDFCQHGHQRAPGREPAGWQLCQCRSTRAGQAGTTAT